MRALRGFLQRWRRPWHVPPGPTPAVQPGATPPHAPEPPPLQQQLQGVVHRPLAALRHGHPPRNPALALDLLVPRDGELEEHARLDGAWGPAELEQHRLELPRQLLGPGGVLDEGQGVAGEAAGDGVADQRHALDGCELGQGVLEVLLCGPTGTRRGGQEPMRVGVRAGRRLSARAPGVWVEMLLPKAGDRRESSTAWRQGCGATSSTSSALSWSGYLSRSNASTFWMCLMRTSLRISRNTNCICEPGMRGGRWSWPARHTKAAALPRSGPAPPSPAATARRGRTRRCWSGRNVQTRAPPAPPRAARRTPPTASPRPTSSAPSGGRRTCPWCSWPAETDANRVGGARDARLAGMH